MISLSGRSTLGFNFLRAGSFHFVIFFQKDVGENRPPAENFQRSLASSRV